MPALPVARSPSADAPPATKIILPPLPMAESAWSGPAKKPPLVPALPCPARSEQSQPMRARGQEVSLRSEHGLQVAQATTPEGVIWRAEQTGKLVPCLPRVRGRDLLQRRALHREYHEPPVFAEPLSDDWDSSAGSAPHASCRAAEPGPVASRPQSRPPAEALRGLSCSIRFRCRLTSFLKVVHTHCMCLFTMGSHSTERVMLCTADEAVDPSGRGPIYITTVSVTSTLHCSISLFHRLESSKVLSCLQEPSEASSGGSSSMLPQGWYTYETAPSGKFLPPF